MQLSLASFEVFGYSRSDRVDGYCDYYACGCGGCRSGRVLGSVPSADVDQLSVGVVY